MLAVVAAVVFLIGLIVRIVDIGLDLKDVWIWLLLGLTLLAAHHVRDVDTPWRRVT